MMLLVVFAAFAFLHRSPCGGGGGPALSINLFSEQAPCQMMIATTTTATRHRMSCTGSRRCPPRGRDLVACADSRGCGTLTGRGGLMVCGGPIVWCAPSPAASGDPVVCGDPLRHGRWRPRGVVVTWATANHYDDDGDEFNDDDDDHDDHDDNDGNDDSCYDIGEHDSEYDHAYRCEYRHDDDQDEYAGYDGDHDCDDHEDHEEREDNETTTMTTTGAAGQRATAVAGVARGDRSAYAMEPPPLPQLVESQQPLPTGLPQATAPPHAIGSHASWGRCDRHMVAAGHGVADAAGVTPAAREPDCAGRARGPDRKPQAKESAWGGARGPWPPPDHSP